MPPLGRLGDMGCLAFRSTISDQRAFTKRVERSLTAVSDVSGTGMFNSILPAHVPYEARVVQPTEWAEAIPLTGEGGVCLPIIWPGMGAVERSLHQFQLPVGVSTLVFEHPSEAVYYVISGEIDVVETAVGSSTRIDTGAMFHVESGTEYRFAGASELAVVIGGPCPADPALYQDKFPAK